MPCTAQGTEENREAHPNTSFPHTVPTWALSQRSRAGGARGSAGSTSTGTLRFFDAVRHFATGSAYIGLAQELAWPSEESNQRTHPDGNNLVGEIQVFFSGIKSLAEFIMWHTQICLHNTSGEQAAVKAASSITWFQLCCCPVFNYYTRTVC